MRKGDMVLLDPDAVRHQSGGTYQKWEVPAYRFASEEDDRRFYELREKLPFTYSSDGEPTLPPRRYLVYLNPDVPYIVTKARIKVPWASKGYAQVFDIASGYEVCVLRSYFKPI